MRIWLGSWGIELNLGELGRRLRFEWRRPTLCLALAVTCLAFLFYYHPWVEPPVLGALQVLGAEEVVLDGDPFPVGEILPLRVGRHVLTGLWSDYYPLTVELTVTANSTATVELAPLYPRPKVWAVLPGAPGHVLRRPELKGEVLRYQSSPHAIPTPTPDPHDPHAQVAGGATPFPQRWELRDGYRARLFELEAYGPLADEAAGRIAYVRSLPESYREQPLSVLTLHRRGDIIDTAVYTCTGEITLLAWSPDGRRLAFAEDLASASRLYLYDGPEVVEVLTFPGTAHALRWGPGGAFVLLSHLDGTVSLTLVDAGARAYYLGDAPVGLFAHNLVPITWGENSVLWSDGQTVWETEIGGVAKARLSTPTRGLFLDQSGNLWYVQLLEGHAAVYREGQVRSEFVIDEVAASVDLAVVWAGRLMLLASGEELVLLKSAGEVWP